MFGGDFVYILCRRRLFSAFVSDVRYAPFTNRPYCAHGPLRTDEGHGPSGGWLVRVEQRGRVVKVTDAV